MYNSKKLFDLRMGRSGVIPYTVIDKPIHGKPTETRKVAYFLLGVDLISNDYCDFGGTAKSNETGIETGLREFREESQGIFEDDNLYHTKHYGKSLSVIAQSEAITFKAISSKWLFTARDEFKNKISGKSRNHMEVADVMWFDQDDFLKMVYNKTNIQLWRKIKVFLQRNVRRDRFLEELRASFINTYRLN